MAEIVNLNKVRKQKAKDEKRARAQENRQKFGLTKGQKATNKRNKKRQQERLDGLRVYRPEQKGDPTD